MSVAVLVKHDMGCRYARPDGGGHSDAAKRLSDTYNLHKAAGSPVGWWLSVGLADGDGGDDLFPSKAEAVRFFWPYEDWRMYVKLGPASMSVCEAESVMAWQRQTNRLHLTDRDDSHGGLEVIPRLNIEHHQRQMAAMRGGVRMPIALGYARENPA